MACGVGTVFVVVIENVECDSVGDAGGGRCVERF